MYLGNFRKNMRGCYMSITKGIKTYVVPKFYSYGFSLEKTGGSSWRFGRSQNGVDQFIEFEKSDWEKNALRVHFYTSSDLSGKFDSHFQTENWRGWTYYTDSDSLRQVLEQFVEISVQYGMPWLESNSIPPLILPKETLKKLERDPEGIASSFEDRYLLQYSDQDAILKLEKLLISQKKLCVEPDWDLVIGAAAFYGEYIRRNIGGEWGTIQGSFYGLKNVVRSIPANPVELVFDFWQKPEEGGLVEWFESFKSL